MTALRAESRAERIRLPPATRALGLPPATQGCHPPPGAATRHLGLPPATRNGVSPLINRASEPPGLSCFRSSAALPPMPTCQLAHVSTCQRVPSRKRVSPSRLRRPYLETAVKITNHEPRTKNTPSAASLRPPATRNGVSPLINRASEPPGLSSCRGSAAQGRVGTASRHRGSSVALVV